MILSMRAQHYLNQSHHLMAVIIPPFTLGTQYIPICQLRPSLQSYHRRTSLTLVAFQLLQAIWMEFSLIHACAIMSQQLLKLSQSSMSKACGNEGMPYCKFMLKVSQVIQLVLAHPTPSSQVSMILFLVWNN